MRFISSIRRCPFMLVHSSACISSVCVYGHILPAITFCMYEILNIKIYIYYCYYL